ncbi:MAG: tetratricopeptide repeat-containing sensor histidine kinase [Chryseolinea sp.]
MRIPLLLLVSLFTVQSFGQSGVDSLKQLLYELNDNQKRVDVLNQLASEIYDVDLNEGLKYATEAYDQALSIKYISGQRKALILVAFRSIVSGEFQQSIKYLRQSAHLSTGPDDLLAYATIMNGNVYTSLALYDSAHYSYTKAIRILEKYPNDAYEAFAYKSLARLYLVRWKNNEASVFFKKALEVYEKLGDRRGQAEIWFALSDVNKNLTDYTLAESYQNEGCSIANKINMDYLILLCYSNRGDYYLRLGEYLKALEVLFKALDILKTKEHPQLQAFVYDHLGLVYEELGQHDVSLKYYFDALKIWERIGVKYEMAALYAEIGWIYKNQSNFAQAKSYMDKSLVLREEIKDEHGISNSFNILGVLFYQEKKYDKSLEMLEKSLEIRKRIGHREGVSATIFNIAAVYEDLGELDKALEYQFRALEIDERIDNKQGLSISYNQIGQLYTKAKNFKEAERFLTKAWDLAKTTGSKGLLMNNRLYFSSFYEAKGDLKKALEYHRLYTALNDSIYSEGNAMKLAEMQALYQVEQKNKEIELLNQNKEIQDNEILIQKSQIRQQRTIIIAGLIGFVLVSIFAFKSYQYTQRIRRANHEILEQKEEIQVQSEELIQANRTIADINKDLEKRIEERTADLRQAYKELDTFFYRSSHDFRRPLTTFLGLAEVANITVKDKNALELFAKVKETASNLDKMLVKLQSISDVGTLQLVYKEVFLKEIIDNVFDNFADEVSAKKIRVLIDIDIKNPIYAYPAMVMIILENLIENAISFSSPVEPFIKVFAHDRDDKVMIEVADNGQGIDSAIQPRIFEMYFRGSDRSKGNGLGLYIVKKAIEKLHGDVVLESQQDRGVSFKITLPSSQNTAEHSG